MDSKKAVVFCSASDTIDPKYNLAARELVRALHALGYSVVSGGGKIGTMGAITDESVKLGGHHVAVLPGFMKGLENPAVSEVVWTDTMSTRKERMRLGCDVAIALPGGIGTLDEIMETLVLRKLSRWDGKVFLLNLDGFYNPLIALLDHYVTTHMMEPRDRALVQAANSPEELVEMLNA